MMKRGGIFFIISFFFSALSYAESMKVNYTVIPMANGLSGDVESSSYFIKNVNGGFHNIISEITKDSGITLNFLSYNDYFSALQNTTIYSPNNNPEIMLGATFSEDITRYVDYVSVPIYSDSTMIVFNKKTSDKDLKFSNILDDDLKNIKSNIVVIKGINIPYLKGKNFEEYKTVNTAMEEVFRNNKILICPKALFDKYIQKNKGTENINFLQSVEYKDSPIHYFIILNKKSLIFKEKVDENHFISDVIFERLQNLIDKNELSKIIENK